MSDSDAGLCYRNFVETFRRLETLLNRHPTCNEVLEGMTFGCSRAYAYILRERAAAEGKLPSGVWHKWKRPALPSNLVRAQRQLLRELLTLTHNLTETEPLAVRLKELLEQHREEIEQMIMLLRPGVAEGS